MPRLNVYGRVLIVRRVLEEDWAPAAAAESLGISRATAYKWLRRFRDEGPAGLADRSSRPHRSRRAGDPGAAQGTEAGPPPPGRDHRPAAVHLLRGAPPPLGPSPGLDGSAHRPGDPPLRTRRPRRADPHRRQEAGPHPSGWRASRPGTVDRNPPADGPGPRRAG